MSEGKPILFSAPMIRALLEGRKTQTRRVLKPQPHFREVWQDEHTREWWQSGYADGGDDPVAGIRYSIGDRLWARETWRADDYSSSRAIYAAEAPADVLRETRGIIRWKPSIHMPRWASRLTLIVTDVRVQRLQDISEKDAIAEGLEYRMDWMPQYRAREGLPWRSEFPRDAFADLWDDVNGPGAWDANPWVAAYSFSIHRCNIDALAANAEAP